MIDRAAFARLGYCWVRSGFSSDTVETLRNEVQHILQSTATQPALLKGASGPAYGARNLLRLWPRIGTYLRQSDILRQTLREILGSHAGIVRGLYFDKPPGSSWALPWHRDLTVAVQTHQPTTGFRNPTIKAGVPHYEAPTSILQEMVTVRIHLDAMTESNGPLRVVPGSHRTDEQLQENAVSLTCEAGDVLLIRPLVLHASGHSDPATTTHRRIIHLECAASPLLPDGLGWDCFFPI